MNADLDSLRQVADGLDVDAVVLVPGPNFSRYVGGRFHQHERPLLVMVPRQGRAVALVPSLEQSAFERTGFDGRVHYWHDADGADGAFDALADSTRFESIAVEGQTMRVFVLKALERAVPGLVVVDAEREISALRQRKSEPELAALRRAVAVTETALGETLETVRVGDTEQAIRSRLLAALYRAGAEALSFPPIVAAGANSADPHAVSRADGTVRAGDALLFDLGAVVDGLYADITRTVYVGHVTDEHHAVHETVLEANRTAIDAVRPGATAGSIDEIATGVLERSVHAAGIRHRTGHGLGRDVHEPPWIVRGDQTALEAGMVFTVEPGLYLPGRFGVRIEDDILVTDTGHACLTGFERGARAISA